MTSPYHGLSLLLFFWKDIPRKIDTTKEKNGNHRPICRSPNWEKTIGDELTTKRMKQTNPLPGSGLKKVGNEDTSFNVVKATKVFTVKSNGKCLMKLTQWLHVHRI